MTTDPFLSHEALDRAHVAAEYFEEHVLGHSYIASNKDLFAQATEIRDRMQSLYQQLGSQALRDRRELRVAQAPKEEPAAEELDPPISRGLSDSQYTSICGLVSHAKALKIKVAFARDDEELASLQGNGIPRGNILVTSRTSHRAAVEVLSRLIAEAAPRKNVNLLYTL